MKVKNLLNNLDKIAPFFLQESFDNSGIQFADLDAPVTKKGQFYLNYLKDFLPSFFYPLLLV